MTPLIIKSPCISLCKLDPTDTYCIGCGRTPGEIQEWSTASEPRKAAIVRYAAIRKETLNPGD